MKLLLTLTAAVAAAAILATAPGAGAAAQSTKARTANRSAVVQVKILRHTISWHRARTWHYQDELGVRRTRSVFSERRIRSVPYLRWDNGLWSHRQARARHALRARLLPSTGDWVTAVRVVQRDWPGTASWLLSCSGGEGGHAYWKWNGGAPYSAGGPPSSYSNGYRTPPAGSSGAGGWMQYMEGTWSGQFYTASVEARQRHLALPSAADSSWTSPVGQAFAAGWARFHHATSAWDPGIDPACA